MRDAFSWTGVPTSTTIKPDFQRHFILRVKTCNNSPTEGIAKYVKESDILLCPTSCVRSLDHIRMVNNHIRKRTGWLTAQDLVNRNLFGYLLLSLDPHVEKHSTPYHGHKPLPDRCWPGTMTTTRKLCVHCNAAVTTMACKPSQKAFLQSQEKIAELLFPSSAPLDLQVH